MNPQDGGVWSHPPRALSLSTHEVHVWRASLQRAAAEVASLRRLLAADERERLEQFYFASDRAKYITARGILRLILSQYLDQDPGHLRFSYGLYGKPALLSRSGRVALRFNLSHSHGLALIAVASERELGIDLEYVRPFEGLPTLARRIFSLHDYARFCTLHPEIACEAFFRAWTRKEAYTKARGTGLSQPMERVEVSFVPGEPARLVRVDADCHEAARWSVAAFRPAPGYLAALVAEGHGWHLKHWRMP